MSRSIAYSVLSVTADDALRYAMGEDVGYKTERQKSHSVSTFTVDITRKLFNIILSKMAQYISYAIAPLYSRLDWHCKVYPTPFLKSNCVSLINPSLFPRRSSTQVQMEVWDYWFFGGSISN